MIHISVDDKHLIIELKDCSNYAFDKAKSWLKKSNFYWNSSKKVWEGPWYKLSSAVDELSEFDIIKNEVDLDKYSQLEEGEPEISRESSRRIFDQTLLNYPPMIGKHPYEDFQKEGIIKGINYSRQYYGWGMGSGKSYVASAIIAHRLAANDISKVLLLTTSIGVRNLKHEILKFVKNLSEDDVAISDKNYRNPFEKDNKAKVVIASYNTFRLICNYYKDKLNIKTSKPRKPFLPLKEWSDGNELMLILDESHCISNPSSQQGNLMALHAPLFKYRYLFSGTPADKPEKIYNQFKILDPWLVYNLSFSDWKNRMAKVGTYFSKYAIASWNKEELEKQNQRFLKRHGGYYSTNDLIELPEYYEKKIYIDMSPQHRRIYQEVVNSSMSSKGTVRDFVNMFPYMQVAVDNPFMLKKHMESFSSDLRKDISSFKESYIEKFNALDDIVSDHDEKILVWGIHPDTIHRIGERYKNLNPICITGATPQEERFELVNKFKTDPKCKMLIANITCLSTSVTITECKVQVYFERSYSFTEYSQSRNRIYRLGQNENVISYILLYNKSLDCLLDKNLDSKGTLVNTLCAKDFMTDEQWAKIFNCSENTELN